MDSYYNNNHKRINAKKIIRLIQLTTDIKIIQHVSFHCLHRAVNYSQFQLKSSSLIILVNIERNTSQNDAECTPFESVKLNETISL